MTITSIGYDGSVDEPAWAALAPTLGTPHTVVALDAFPSIVTGEDRTVQVPPGRLAGWGILDTLTGTNKKQAATIGSGSRWDTLVLRRNWQTNTSSLEFVSGTTTQAVSGAIEVTPGTIADQVLGIGRVQAGATAMQEFIPLAEYAFPPRFRFGDTLPAPGAYPYGQVYIQTVGQTLDLVVRRGSNASPVWGSLTNTPWANLTMSSGYRTHTGRIPRVRLCMGRIELDGWVERTTGAMFADSYTKIAQLPSNAYPDRDINVPLAGNFDGSIGLGAALALRTSGAVEVIAPTGKKNWLALDGVSVPQTLTLP